MSTIRVFNPPRSQKALPIKKIDTFNPTKEVIMPVSICDWGPFRAALALLAADRQRRACAEEIRQSAPRHRNQIGNIMPYSGPASATA